jgi:hypothetical protein
MANLIMNSFESSLHWIANWAGGLKWHIELEPLLLLNAGMSTCARMEFGAYHIRPTLALIQDLACRTVIPLQFLFWR